MRIVEDTEILVGYGSETASSQPIAAHEAAPSTEMISALPGADGAQFTRWSRLSE